MVYKVATNSFLAIGGDGYQAFENAIERYDTSIFQRDACIEYLIDLGGKVKPELKNKIRLIQSEPGEPVAVSSRWFMGNAA